MNMNSADTNLANDYAKARDLRNELRRLEESISRRAERSPITEADEHRMTEFQGRADAAYSAAGRRAPPPLPLERPEQYRRRLADGLKGYSPRWSNADLNVVTDDTALGVIEGQIYADAATHGRTQGLAARQIREHVSRTSAGHTQVEFVGGPEAHFVRAFERPARRATFKQPEAYQAMSNASQMAQVAHAYHRPTVQSPRASF
jgi:hypothetical protein